MDLIECQTKFKNGLLSKSDYLDQIYNLHLSLFNFAKYIKNTDISSIEIKNEEAIIFHLKNGIKLHCSSPDKGSAAFAILSLEFYEKKEIKFILKLLKKNMVFFDIGANIGFHALNVAKHDGSIAIHSFEPIPETFTILNSNILLNEIKNINTHNFGISNENNSANFYFNPNASGATSLKKLFELSEVKLVQSKVLTLDKFMKDNCIQQLDFIKCDVEGAEILVIQGGIDTIKNQKPIIFLEMLRKWSHKFNYHPNDIIKLLANLNYSCFTINEENLSIFNSMDENTTETNFFFLHQDKHIAEIKKWVV